MDGVLHDRVVHFKKRVEVRVVWKWLSPRYVKIVEHKFPGKGGKLKVKAGAQVVDRCWRFLKQRISSNQNSKAGSKIFLRAKLRSAQCQYLAQGRGSLGGNRSALRLGVQTLVGEATRTRRKRMMLRLHHVEARLKMSGFGFLSN